MGNGPELWLCNACGEWPTPSLQDIWRRIAMTDDDGTEWGPTPHECDSTEEHTAMSRAEELTEEQERTIGYEGAVEHDDQDAPSAQGDGDPGEPTVDDPARAE